MTEPRPLPDLVAVTGGTGFIGAHVVRLLLDRGVAVRVFALPSDPCHLLEGLDVEIVRGDLATGEGFAAQGAHLVGDIVYTLVDPRIDFEARE